MLPVETELHLALKVEAAGLEINDLAAWAFGDRNEWACRVMAHVLWQMQEHHLARVLSGEKEVFCTGCGVVHSGPGSVLRRGSRARKVRTSSGRVRFRLRQLTCRDCGKTWSPYPELLGLAPRQRVTDELARRLVDWVTELSYGKTSRLGTEWLGATLSARQLHREVQERGERIEFTEGERLRTLAADGTKVPAGEKFRGEEVVAAFQIEGREGSEKRPRVKKRVVGFGVGWGAWQEALATASEPDLVVTDGEPGVAELIEWYYPGARHQRCEWHLPYSLAHVLGREGMEVRERQQVAGKLSGLLDRGGPDARTRYETFTARDLAGYPEAQTLLDRAAPYVLYEEPSAEVTTSIAERQMREINRRTDVGARWTVSGVSNMLKLRLAQQHNADDYERVWTDVRSTASQLVPRA